MKARGIPGALALALVAAGCAGARRPGPAPLPREALPTTFEPLRWSVQPDDIPALFPNHEARRFRWRGRERHVGWSVDDVRRVAGQRGTLYVDWEEGGGLWRVRLAFADPRRECDPDLGELPLRCEVPGAALQSVFDALAAELAQGRGAPVEAPAGAAARSVSWSGIGFALRLSLVPDDRGAWSADVVATPLRAGGREGDR